MRASSPLDDGAGGRVHGLNRSKGEIVAGRCAVAVALAGGCPDRVTGLQLDDIAPLDLNLAKTRDREEDLAARVGVPEGLGAVQHLYRRPGQVCLLAGNVAPVNPRRAAAQGRDRCGLASLG